MRKTIVATLMIFLVVGWCLPLHAMTVVGGNLKHQALQHQVLQNQPDAITDTHMGQHHRMAAAGQGEADASKDCHQLQSEQEQCDDCDAKPYVQRLLKDNANPAERGIYKPAGHTAEHTAFLTSLAGSGPPAPSAHIYSHGRHWWYLKVDRLAGFTPLEISARIRI